MGGQPTEVIATEAWLDRHSDLVQALDASVVGRSVTAEVLGAALTTVTPDGVACLCRLSLLPKPPKTCDFWLVLDRIQDPGNLGSLLRTALAADVQSVWMGSGVDPLGGKALRASAGALLQLPHHRFGPEEKQAIDDLDQALRRLVDQGIQVVATLIPWSTRRLKA